MMRCRHALACMALLPCAPRLRRPPCPGSRRVRILSHAGALLLVMCVALAASVLTASFAVFLVRWVGRRAGGGRALRGVGQARPDAAWGWQAQQQAMSRLQPCLMPFWTPARRPQGARQRQQGGAGGGGGARQRLLGRQLAVRPRPVLGGWGRVLEVGQLEAGGRRPAGASCWHQASLSRVSARPAACHPARPQLPAALIVALFAGSGLPAYAGPRLASVAALLWGSAPAALCLTYLLQAAFEVSGGRAGMRDDLQAPRVAGPTGCCPHALLANPPRTAACPPCPQDEVRVLVRLNSLYFTAGGAGGRPGGWRAWLGGWCVLDTTGRPSAGSC